MWVVHGPENTYNFPYTRLLALGVRVGRFGIENAYNFPYPRLLESLGGAFRYRKWL